MKKRIVDQSSQTRKALGAFNQGVAPTIACFNKAKTSLSIDLDTLINGMQEYVDKQAASVPLFFGDKHDNTVMLNSIVVNLLHVLR